MKNKIYKIKNHPKVVGIECFPHLNKVKINFKNKHNVFMPVVPETFRETLQDLLIAKALSKKLLEEIIHDFSLEKLRAYRMDYFHFPDANSRDSSAYLSEHCQEALKKLMIKNKLDAHNPEELLSNCINLAFLGQYEMAKKQFDSIVYILSNQGFEHEINSACNLFNLIEIEYEVISCERESHANETLNSASNLLLQKLIQMVITENQPESTLHCNFLSNSKSISQENSQKRQTPLSGSMGINFFSTTNPCYCEKVSEIRFKLGSIEGIEVAFKKAGNEHGLLIYLGDKNPAGEVLVNDFIKEQILQCTKKSQLLNILQDIKGSEMLIYQIQFFNSDRERPFAGKF